jgi:hypothetical protein
VGQNRSANIGQAFSIGLMMGMSRLLGDLLLKAAMLKLHLWYLSYYSPRLETTFGYILYLEDNPLVENLFKEYQGLFPNHWSTLRAESYTRTYVTTTSLVLNLAPLAFEAAAVLLQVLMLALLALLFRTLLAKPARAGSRKKNTLRRCWLELSLFFGCSRLEVLILVNIQLGLVAELHSPIRLLGMALLALVLLSSVKNLASVKGAAHWEKLLVLVIQIRYLVYPCCFLLSQDVYLQLAVPMLVNLAIMVLVFLIYLYSPVPCASLPLLLFVLFEALVMLLVEIYLIFS